MDELKRLGIVSIRTSLALEIADEDAEGADATSGNREMKVEAKKDAAKETKLQTKMDDLMWKFNLLMFVFCSFSWCCDHVSCCWSQVDGAFRCS